MTADTITIPAEIPREIVVNGKVRKIVGFEFRRAERNEFRWLYEGWVLWDCIEQSGGIYLIAILATPEPEWWEPTPAEACRLLAESIEENKQIPVVGLFESGPLKGQSVSGCLEGIDISRDDNIYFVGCNDDEGFWCERIRVRKSE